MTTQHIEAILRDIAVPEALYSRLLPLIEKALGQCSGTPNSKTLMDITYYFAFTDPEVRRAVNYRHPLDTFC